MKSRQRDLTIVFFLVVLTIVAFWKVRDFDFVNLDDDVYVTANHHVRTGLNKLNAVWAFTTTHAGFWIPLTWLSFMLDSELYGLNPQGYHMTNLFLHIFNTLLLFGVLKRFTASPWKSALVAALFSVHPLHVESVAWVTERKDVLSAFFALIALGLYSRYVQSQTLKRYALCIIAFAASLMAKPMLVTLPVLLVLLDYWPLGRWPISSGDDKQVPEGFYKKNSRLLPFRLIGEKVPFFLLSSAAGVLTFLSHQASGGMASLQSLSVNTRVANSLVSYVSYIWKMIWPQNLSVFYPHAADLPAWKVTGAGAAVALMTSLTVLLVRKRPYLFVGWVWYLLSLFPVIGIVQVGRQSMADRFTYIPLIGLFVIVVWGVSDATKGCPYRRPLLSFLGAIVLTVCSVLTWHQVGYWRNSIVLFERALTVTEESDLVYNNLASALARRGRFKQAIEHGKQALSINPENAWTYNNMGVAWAGLNKPKEALRHYKAALRIKPEFASAHGNLGNLLARQGRFEEAIEHYGNALDANPYDVNAQNNLAYALVALGKYEKAVTHYCQALAMMPNHDAARSGLKAVLQKFEGKYQWEEPLCSDSF